MIDEEISRSTIAISVRASKLTARGLARSARSGGGTCRFFTTDDPERFARTGRLFLDMPLGGDDVTLVDL